MAFRKILLALLWVCWGVALLQAQSTTATIQGLVTDQQKALVPGVMVTARNLETNATRSVISNDEGLYRIPNLPVGTYEVAIELAGFRKVRLTVCADAEPNAGVACPIAVPVR